MPRCRGPDRTVAVPSSTAVERHSRPPRWRDRSTRQALARESYPWTSRRKGGSDGWPIQKSVTCTPLSQIGPTICRSSAPAVAASLPTPSELGPAGAHVGGGRPSTPSVLNGPGDTAASAAMTMSISQERSSSRRPGAHRAPPEPQIARRLVAHHRVHRADDLEEDDSRKTADDMPKQDSRSRQ